MKERVALFPASTREPEQLKPGVADGVNMAPEHRA